MNDTTPRYALSARTDAPFAEVDRRVRDALESEGFGVLTEIDVSTTLAKKLDVEIPRYEILGACAPPLAYRALQLDPDIGLLLWKRWIPYSSSASRRTKRAAPSRQRCGRA